MSYKYIYSEQGQREAVIVPISEWERLVGDAVQDKPRRVRLMDMIGLAKGSFSSAQEADDYLDKLRKEWD